MTTKVEFKDNVKDQAKSLANEIKEGRKHIKEQSAKHANYFEKVRRGVLTWKEVHAFGSTISRTNEASKEARSLNLVSAFLNGTPSSKVETYFYEDGKPVRFDGKAVTSKRVVSDWTQREVWFNEAVEGAKAVFPEELKAEFECWLRGNAGR